MAMSNEEILPLVTFRADISTLHKTEWSNPCVHTVADRIEVIMNRQYQSSLTSLAVDTNELHGKHIECLPSRSVDRLVSQNHCTDNVQDTLALILAGGRGTRLLPLTQERCKPAVPFGGSFKIIDFTLSNCLNSGIRRIGVLTQYEQHSLIRHLQQGWNIFRREQNEFLDILPAQQRHGNTWYRGTADAVSQNLDLLKNLSPRHTLILAGDHIYKADYRRMIREHVANNAEVTIACCEVPLENAGQFGIVRTDTQNRIKQFDEKPSRPQGIPGRAGVAHASMGVYLFNTELLLNCLKADIQAENSSHDFGSDIIPSLIETNRVLAYEFERAQIETYWRDVGTLDAYYEANMQLLELEPSIELHNRSWPIHTHISSSFPVQFTGDSIGHRGLASDCIVGSGCVLRGSMVRHSVVFSDVQIHERTQIDNSLILPGAVIGERCRIKNAIIDSRTRIPDGTEIGYDPYADALRYRVSEKGIVVVAANTPDAPSVKSAGPGAKSSHSDSTGTLRLGSPLC
ncbi:MAG: glucose-1-phosphate adenylyltransferase [Granulosicoccus sp.]